MNETNEEEIYTFTSKIETFNDCAEIKLSKVHVEKLKTILNVDFFKQEEKSKKMELIKKHVPIIY